jgi:hypothetical protein
MNVAKNQSIDYTAYQAAGKTQLLEPFETYQQNICAHLDSNYDQEYLHGNMTICKLQITKVNALCNHLPGRQLK